MVLTLVSVEATDDERLVLTGLWFAKDLRYVTSAVFPFSDFKAEVRT